MTRAWIHACTVLLAALCGPGSTVSAQSVPAAVPDAVARRSGLRLVPMAHAARTYAENCQGCHGEAGVSVTEIPPLAGRVGYFARTPLGREYLVQVPNVALNPSSDADIAELMNWLLATYSRAQMPADFVPYTAGEVATLRRVRIDPAAARRRVVEDLSASGLLPDPDALAVPHRALY